MSSWIRGIEDALFEEPGWYLLPASIVNIFKPGEYKQYSIIYHICTQLQNVQGQGRYKGQRKWVDENTAPHTFSITTHSTIHYKCSKCGFGASDDLKGLFMLHNFDRFAK